MNDIRSTEQESAEDVFFGQVVTIWARWFLIAAGVLLTLWVTQDPGQLAVTIVPVVVLVAVNFYLHGRYITERPANSKLVMAVGIVDLAVITAAVLVWPGGKGFFSPFYVLYFPVLLSFAFVMPRKVTIAFTAVALAAYLGTVLVAEVIYEPHSLYPSAATSVEVGVRRSLSGQTVDEKTIAATVKEKTKDEVGLYMLTTAGLGDEKIDVIKVLVMRLITLAAMGGLGTYYWRIQRDRRRDAAGETPGVGENAGSGTDPSTAHLAGATGGPATS